MKQIKFFAIALAVSAWVSSCDNHNTNANFPVLHENHAEGEHHGEHGEHGAHGETEGSATGSFGEEISEAGALSGTELVSSLEKQDSVAGKFSVKIIEACQKKGCWMMVDLNGTPMRVTFKDYGFFVPKNSAGHTAIIEGVAHKEELSVATLKHYAEDAGQSKEEIAAITKPETEYSFEAVGVIIK